MEFGETLAMWVQGVIQAAMNDPTGQWTGRPLTDFQCPLTLQEVLLLLRNVMMSAFKDTQGSVQGVAPYVPTSTGNNQFVSYLASSATCFLEQIDMKLPRAFVENIRALTVRTTYRSRTDIEYFIPVLGQYALDVLQSSVYTFSGGVAGGPLTVHPCFATGAIYKKKVFDEKTELWSYKELVEDAINLVDGSSSSGFVAINNPQQLKTLVMMWNKWIAELNLSSYSSSLSTYGTEKGVNVLCSVNMTRHWTIPSVPRALAIKEKKYVNMRLEKQEYLQVSLSPFNDRWAIADTSQTPLIATAYEQFQNTWILPSIQNESTTSGGGQSTIVPRWQSLMRETQLQNFSSGDDGQSMSQLHQSYANKMIKGKLDQENDWDVFFKTCDEKGEGGILSGLVGSALSALFPKAAPVIGAIADAVPF